MTFIKLRGFNENHTESWNLSQTLMEHTSVFQNFEIESIALDGEKYQNIPKGIRRSV